jgi:hypothetical protein
MKFNAGDKVWAYFYDSRLEATVIGVLACDDQVIIQHGLPDCIYVVEVPGRSSSYPGREQWPRGVWRFPAVRLQPRGDECDDRKLGSWDLCPWQPKKVGYGEPIKLEYGRARIPLKVQAYYPFD